MENNLSPESIEMAFCRPLKEVVPRIELLGFTLDQIRHEYASCVESWREECEAISDDEDESVADVMTFAEFCAFATAHPLETLDDSFISSFNAESEAQIRGRFGDMTVTRRLPYFSPSCANASSERSYFAGLIGFLHPYALLRLLAQNACNLDADVVWQYGPLLNAGWASESEFVPGARRNQTC